MTASLWFLASTAACALLAYLVLRGRRVGLLDLTIACALAAPVDWLALLLRGSFSTSSGWSGLIPMLGLFLVLPVALFLTLAAWFIAARLVHKFVLGWSEPGSREMSRSVAGAARYWLLPMGLSLLLGWGLAFLAVRASRSLTLALHVPESVLFFAVVGTFALFGVLDTGVRIVKLWARRSDEPVDSE